MLRLLKYAILGLVNRAPVTGYDIAKEFDRGLVNFWYATHSQIYPELRRLTEEGLVTFEIDTRGDRLEKKRYFITEKGKQELTNWISQHDELEPTPKDAFRLRLYFLPEVDHTQMHAALEDQIEKRSLKLQRLVHNMQENRQNSTYGQIYDKELGDYLVLCGAISREKDYIAWLRFCMETIEKLAK